MSKVYPAVILLFTLIACSPAHLPVTPTQQPPALTRSSATQWVQMRWQKQDLPSAAVVVSGEQRAITSVKPVLNAPLRYRKPTDLNAQTKIEMAQIGLDGMDRAPSWSEGRAVGLPVLEKLGKNDSYIAQLSKHMNLPGLAPESSYKVIAYALDLIASGQDFDSPTIAQPNVDLLVTSDFILRVMRSAKTWQDGSRMAFYGISMLIQTALRPTPQSTELRKLMETSLTTAQKTTFWEEHFRILEDTLQVVRTRKAY